MAAWVIWFIIAGILFIAEMLSITFYMLWLGIGAVVGGLIALFVPEALLLQVVAGAIVSLTLTFFTKRISKNFREAKGFTDTVDMLAGKKRDCYASDYKRGEWHCESGWRYLDSYCR